MRKTVPSAPARPQVIHIATRYLRGGSERRIRDFVRSFPEGDHHVVLGAESDPDLARSQLEPRSLTIIPSLVREPDLVNDVIALAKLAALLRRSPFDVVVTHQSKAGVLGRTAARMSGRPPVIHSLSMTSFGPGYPAWQDRLHRILEARLARLTTTYAVVGRDLASRYHSIGIPQSKLIIVRSGVCLPSMKAATARARRRACDDLGIPSDRRLVLYLGSLEPRKNVLSLPTFLAQLLALESDDRPFLVVAGEGPLSDDLERRLEATGLAPDAALVGFVPDPEPLISMANAIVLLSNAEGVPQVLVQAAAAGTPFVAYAVDGAQELVDEGAVGTVVPIGDVGAAARAAAEVMRGRRGRSPSIDLSGWDEAEIVAGYRGLLESALCGRGNGHATANGHRGGRLVRSSVEATAASARQRHPGMRA